MKTSKLLVRFSLLLGLFSCLAFGLELSEIDNTMTQNIQKTMNILQKTTSANPKDSTLSNAQAQQIAKEIFTLFDSIFDYSLMAQLSLSQEYKTLSESQKSEYTRAFEQNLKKSFTDKLRLYKDENMEVVGGEQTKSNRYNLKTTMVLDGKLNSIIFKFYDNKGDWKIYDVDILGISVIQTYRSQFSDILAHSDFQTLLTKLKSEITFESPKQ
ncbi:ABC transporter substrate-binding protein [Helicobacter sp. MIT 05-5294]|uniref:Tgt2/MlaC family protein n=1 Tax=Helicobacter sp. MIT 05-5294 TaxID=1548150 RepID=UPI00051FB659|nr:ABC transporter substrate-binding protein [Helicobacter sp. MIT 05-5294]